MRSRLFSRVLIIGLCLFFLLLAILASVPAILSTSWGTTRVVALINAYIPGQVEIRKVHLAWGHGQSFEGIVLKDPAGQEVLEADYLSTEATLWELINQSTHLGHTVLRGFNAFLVTDEQGITNLQHALGLEHTSDYTALPSTITLSQVDADVNLFAKKDPLSVEIHGLTEQGPLTGSFNIHASLKELTAQTWQQLGQEAQQLLTLEGQSLTQLSANIVNFPVDLLDQFVVLKNPELAGIFRAAFGETINVKLDQQPSSKGLAFEAQLTSPLMQGKFKGLITPDSQLVLQEASTFQLHATPKLVNSLAKGHFHLLSPTQLSLTLEDLSLPLKFFTDQKEALASCDIGFKADVSIPSTSVEIKPLIGQVDVRRLHIGLSSPLCGSVIDMHFAGEAQQKQEPFNFQFNLNVPKPGHLKDFFQEILKHSQATAQLRHVPATFLASALNQPVKSIESIFGSYLDLQAILASDQDGLVHVQLHTPRFLMSGAIFQFTPNTLILKHPFQVQALVEPMSFNSTLALTQPSHFVLTVKHLELPWKEINQSSIQAELEAQQPIWLSLEELGLIHINQFKTEINGSLSRLHTKCVSQVLLFERSGAALPIWPDAATIRLNSIAHLDAKQQLENVEIQTDIQSKKAHVSFKGSVNANHVLTFTTPIQMHGELTAQQIQAIGQKLAFSIPSIVSSPTFNMQIEPASFSLSPEHLDQLYLYGTLSIHQLALQDAQGLSVAWKELTIPWEIDCSTQSFYIDVKGTTTSSQHKSSYLTAHCSMHDWLTTNQQFNLDRLKLDVDIKLTNIPTILVSALAGQDDLSLVIGDVVDIELKTLMDRQQRKPGYWDMNIDSPYLHVGARLKFNEVVTLYDAAQKPAKIRWTLTPEGYQHLQKRFNMKDTQIALEDSVSFQGTLNKLYLPLQSKKSLFEEGKVDIQLATDQIKCKSQISKQPLAPFALEARLNSDHLSDHIYFNIHTQSKSSFAFALDGEISNLSDKTGSFNLQQADLKLNANAQQLPLTLLRHAFLLSSDQEQLIEALIGPTIEAKASIKITEASGPIVAKIQGHQGQIILDSLLKKGVLTLRQPLEWTIQVTPKFSHLFLNRYVSFLGSAVGSDKPIKILIDPAGCRIPLIPFDIQNIEISSGMIDLGRIHCLNTGELQSLLSTLKPIPQDQLTLWFTPLYFQISQGQLSLQRFDIHIAGLYDLACWGNAHLIDDKAEMTLGLSPQALEYAFDVQGLEPDYLLQVPLKRKHGKLQVDKKKATSRISALVAQTRGGIKGKIIGSLLEIASGDKEEPTPAPTTQPFPWKSQNQAGQSMQSPPSKDQQNSHKHSSETNQVLKGLEKGAEAILDILKH